MSDSFTELSKDAEFVLHFSKCWPRLRLALIEKQFDIPADVMKKGDEEIGRRTLFLREMIGSLENLAKPEIDPTKRLQPKRLNNQRFQTPFRHPSQTPPS